MQVTDSVREKQKALVGFIGPSGAGKTVGAILTAYGMMREAYPDLSEQEVWKKIGVADTEHKRSMLYVDQQFSGVRIGSFKHINFEPPYTTERYLQALLMLKNAGVEVVVFDSLSHNWNGDGGILEQHGNMTGNSFQNWNKMNKHVTDMIKALSSNDIHILATMRTKNEYVMELNDKGKQQPRKIGTKPVQKDDMEYEFMLNFSVDMDHLAIATKDNTNLFEDEEIQLNEEVGRKLYRYLELGVDVQAEERARREEEEANRLSNVAKIRELSSTDANAAKIVSDCEFKANIQLENMTVPMVDKIIKLIGGKLNV
ncbi:hypothetical protein C7Y47_22180 [Lysinibacillus sphaericus]|uniref:AAA+ ATPase domain-containing protein n=1 Tax=Lysinibacillus sphaericus TaxID=1421 RepID=A0A544U8C9_LYSSH|nr:hypothetical protein [Lysinibacillus sp. SDF0037]TQR28351.1 hypothetical protein C7Y47_22180 [Lysinibacillus sp. SDF0037]